MTVQSKIVCPWSVDSTFRPLNLIFGLFCLSLCWDQCRTHFFCLAEIMSGLLAKIWKDNTPTLCSRGRRGLSRNGQPTTITLYVFKQSLLKALSLLGILWVWARNGWSAARLALDSLWGILCTSFRNKYLWVTKRSLCHETFPGSMWGKLAVYWVLHCGSLDAAGTHVDTSSDLLSSVTFCSLYQTAWSWRTFDGLLPRLFPLY